MAAMMTDCRKRDAMAFPERLVGKGIAKMKQSPIKASDEKNNWKKMVRSGWIWLSVVVRTTMVVKAHAIAAPITARSPRK